MVILLVVCLLSSAFIVPTSASESDDEDRLLLPTGESVLWFRAPEVEQVGVPASAGGALPARMSPEEPDNSAPVVHSGTNPSPVVLESQPLASETRFGGGDRFTQDQAVARMHVWLWTVPTGGTFIADLNAVNGGDVLPLASGSVSGVFTSDGLIELEIPMVLGAIPVGPEDENGDFVVPEGYRLQFVFRAMLTAGTLYSVFYDSSDFAGQIEILVSPFGREHLTLTGPDHVAAGQVSDLFTVELRDGDGNPTIASPDVNIVLSSNSEGGVTFYESDGETEVNTITIPQGGGEVFFRYRDTRADVGTTIRIYDIGRVFAPTTFALDVLPAPAVGSMSSISVDRGVLIDEEGNVTVHLRDQFGNKLSGGGDLVCLSITEGALHGGRGGCSEEGQVQAVDQGDGNYTTRVGGTVKGTVTSAAGISGTVNGEPIGGIASVAMATTPHEGTADATQSTITAQPNEIGADGEEGSTITITLKDAFGGEVIQGDATVCVQATLGFLSSGHGRWTCEEGEIQAEVDPDNPVIYKVILMSTVLGEATVTAKVNGNELPESVTVSFVLATGPPTLDGPEDITAGEIGGPFTITVRDLEGGPLEVPEPVGFGLSSDSGGDVTFYADPDGTQELEDNEIVVEEGESQVDFWYVDTMANEGTGITATWVFGVGEMDSVTHIVDFTVGDPHTVRVETQEDGFGTLVGEVVESGDFITIYAIVRDAVGNFVGNEAADWSLLDATEGIDGGDLVPNADSRSATFTGNLVGTTKVQVTSGDLVPESSQTITVVPGKATGIDIGGPSQAIAGDPSDVFTLFVVDIAGNPTTVDQDKTFTLASDSTEHEFLEADGETPIEDSLIEIEAEGGLYSFTYSDTKASPEVRITAEFEHGGLDLGSAEILFEVVAGAPDAGMSTITAQPHLIVVDRPDESTITVITRDTFGNVRAGGGDVVCLVTDLGQLASSNNKGGCGNDEIQADHVGNGGYTASLSSTQEGTATIKAFFGPATDGQKIGEKMIEFVPETLDHITLTGPSQFTAGQINGPFTITVRDRDGNPREVFEPVSFDLTSSSQGVATFYADPDGNQELGNNEIIIGEDEHQADFWFNDTQASTSAQVTVAWKSGGPNEGLGSRSVVFTVVPDVADSGRSTIAVQSQQIVADGQDSTMITVTVRDAHDNVRAGGGDVMCLMTDLGQLSSTLGQGGCGSGEVQPDHGGNGEYASILSGTQEGSANVKAFLGPVADGQEIGEQTIELVKQTLDHITLTGPNQFPAGQISGPFTITLHNQIGNPMSVNEPITFILSGGSEDTVTFYADPDGNQELGNNETTISAGDDQGVFWFSDTKANPGKQVTVAWKSGGPNEGLGSKNAVFNVVPGVASPGRSTITVQSQQILADGQDSTVITVTVKDVHDNVRTGGGDVVCLETNLGELSSATGQGHCAGKRIQADHGTNGQYTVTLGSTKAGTATITGIVNVQPLTQQSALELVSGPVDRIAIDGALRDLESEQGNKGAVTYKAEAWDAHDNKVAVDDKKDLKWTVSPAKGGTFNESVFTPSGVVGDYTITVSLSSDAGVTDATNFTIKAVDETKDKVEAQVDGEEDQPGLSRPGSVTDLRVTPEATTWNSVQLEWTAPAAPQGTVSKYWITVSPEATTTQGFVQPVTEGEFLEFTPSLLAVPGEPQRATVLGLQPDTLYHFALKAEDGQGNLSGLSNVVEGQTLEAFDPVAANAALQATVSLHSAAEGIEVSWDPAQVPEHAEGILIWRMNSPVSFVAAVDASNKAFEAARIVDSGGTSESGYLLTLYYGHSENQGYNTQSLASVAKFLGVTQEEMVGDFGVTWVDVEQEESTRPTGWVWLVGIVGFVVLSAVGALVVWRQVARRTERTRHTNPENGVPTTATDGPDGQQPARDEAWDHREFWDNPSRSSGNR